MAEEGRGREEPVVRDDSPASTPEGPARSAAVAAGARSARAGPAEPATFLGVDLRQWRVLTVAALRIDLRTGGSGYDSSGSRGRKGLIFLALFHLGLGVAMVPTVVFTPDRFLGATILLTMVMFMVGANVLIEFHSIIVSPDDWAILGHRPVSSRTYFAVRLTNVLVYTGALASLVGLPGAVAFFFVGTGPDLVRGLGAVVALYLTTLATTLAMIVLYGVVIRIVPADRLQRGLSYLQLLLSAIVYGGYFLLPQLVDRETLAALEVDKTPVIFLHPATWYASVVDLASGRWGAWEVVPATVGLGAVAGLLAVAGGKLSLEYSQRLSELDSSSDEPGDAAAGPGRLLALFRRGEGRAAALLIRAQFRHDRKFRLAVLGILPLTFLYLVLGLREGRIPDPFEAAGFAAAMQAVNRATFLHLAVFLFPLMLRTSLTSSDSYRASWVFFATPSDPARLVLETKNVVIAYFLAPYLAVLAALFAWFFGDPLHAVLHVVVLGLMAHAMLQLAVMISPALPFSMPLRKGQRSREGMFFIFGTMLVAFGAVPFILGWAYATTARTVGLLVALGVMTWVLEKASATRVEWMARRFEYVS